MPFPALLLQILIVLIIVGVALWIVAQIPMDPAFAKIIRVVIIVFFVCWLLWILIGLLPGSLFYPYRR